MSLATASNSRNGEPDTKKFRFELPTQVVVNNKSSPLYDMNQNQGENQLLGEPIQSNESGEEFQLNGYPSCSRAKSPCSRQQSPPGKIDDVEEKTSASLTFPIKHEGGHHMGSVNESSVNADNEDLPEEPFKDSISALLEQAASAFLKNLQEESPNSVANAMPSLTPPPTQSHQSMHAPIPGALAVAASPAAQLFDENDWSWHRNPAAAIRSGGTNKQTPVWKYFVYNKAENLSRCIIGTCNYVLKGPHTSTLACHLKKHTAEYAEFQKLKIEYTRERSLGNISNNGSVAGTSRNGRASSAASNGSNGSINGHSTSAGCNNKQGSSNCQPQISAPSSTPNASSMPSNSTGFSKNLSDQQQNPLSGIFAANSLLAANKIAGISRHQLTSPIKNPSSMSELLSNLSVRAVANLASQNPVTSSTNLTSTSSPINTPSMTPTSEHQMVPPLHFMNLLKQNSGIFGPNNGSYDQKTSANMYQQQQLKKWPRHERKHRELETKLALVMCSLQIPSHKLNDSFLRDFLETAQPKFQLPTSSEPLEQTLTQMYTRALANMKISLANTSRFTLMVNAIKPNKLNALTKTDDKESTQKLIWLSISVSYYAQTQQRIETMLLGIRLIDSSDIVRNAKSVVLEVLGLYELNLDQVSKTILDGFEAFGVFDDQLDFPNKLRSYRSHLMKTMHEAFDKSELYLEIRAAVLQMIQSFCNYPEAMLRLSRLCGTSLIASLQQLQFEKLVQVLLEIREPFLAVCCQQPSDQFINVITESQWAIVDNILRLKRIFNAHMEIVQDNSYATIDRVVPSIMQLLVTLKKDFLLLDELSAKLATSIQENLAYILNPQADDFDSSYIQATALNPQLVVLLDESQLNSAKSQIEKALHERIRNTEESMSKRSGWKTNGGVDALLAAVVERKSTALIASTPPDSAKSSDDEPNKSASSLYPDLVQAANQRRKQIKERNQNGKNHYAEAMVQAYFEDALNNVGAIQIAQHLCIQSSFPTLFGTSTSVPSQPFQFWQSVAMKCAQLSELAVELLSIPASTIPPECILNPPIEGGSTLLLDEFAAKHPFEFISNAQSTHNLERDAIIRFNRSFWQKSPFL